jgi:hypothetical protein
MVNGMIMNRRGVIRERVIRVLLNQPQGTITRYRVSKEAKCSYSWVHDFLRKLEGLGLLDGTKVKDYRGLVHYWQDVKTRPEIREYMHKDPGELVKSMLWDYALTTYHAENLVQHYLFPSRTDVYIRKDDLDKWHESITREGLVGKGNLRLLITDEHVFYRPMERQGFRIVSLPQLIVDLLCEGGVCVDAADKLLGRAAENVRSS